MDRKAVGRSGVTVSEIVLGTWAMGGTYWGPADDQASIRAIHRALDRGMNTLDTAEAYNDGYSEKVIGRAIKGRAHDVVISTKVANYHSAYQDVKAACERSLRNLGRDCIDIYFLHWPSSEFGHPHVPMEETLQAIVELKAAGKIRAFGLSNFQRADFQRAARMVRVDAYQPPFNILWRGADPMLAYCMEKDIAVLPYAAVAQGLLTGTMPPGHPFGPGDKRADTPLFQPANWQKAWELVKKLEPFAKKYGKTLVQFVLRWTMQVPGIAAPLVGGRTEQEIEDGIGATGWRMTDQDFAAVDQMSKAYFAALPPYKNYFNAAV